MGTCSNGHRRLGALMEPTHLGLDKDAPTTRAVEMAPDDDAEVVSLPRLGGLHHRYSWRAPEGAWT